MNNPETLTTPAHKTQEEDTQNTKTGHNTENYKDEQHGSSVQENHFKETNNNLFWRRNNNSSVTTEYRHVTTAYQNTHSCFK